MMEKVIYSYLDRQKMKRLMSSKNGLSGEISLPDHKKTLRGSSFVCIFFSKNPHHKPKTRFARRVGRCTNYNCLNCYIIVCIIPNAVSNAAYYSKCCNFLVGINKFYETQFSFCEFIKPTRFSCFVLVRF